MLEISIPYQVPPVTKEPVEILLFFFIKKNNAYYQVAGRNVLENN